MNRLVGLVELLIGVVLLVGASSLSLRYNAWTTRFRERHPNINPPPTPEARARNTRRVRRMLRFLGVWLFLIGALLLATAHKVR